MDEWEMHGDGNGAFGAMPATDKAFRVGSLRVGAVDPSGQVTVHRDYWDRPAWMTQVCLATPSDPS